MRAEASADAAAATAAALLAAIGRGEKQALGDLYAHCYVDLLRQARWRVRRTGDAAALDATALVHESFLRFARSGASDFADRDAFMAYAAEVMRSVAIDAVRRHGCERRGGGAVHVELDDSLAESTAAPSPACPARRVQESLEELAAVDARQARVVEMRYFDGMSKLEIAGTLGIGVRTVARDWQKARAYLQMSLR